MKIHRLLPLALALLIPGCGESPSGSGSTTSSTNASGGNPLTAPVDYLGAVGNAQRSAVKTIDTTAINSAIQLFQVEKGRYPTDLDELVKTKFLPQVPAAPYGYKINYDPSTGQVKVVKQ